MKKIKLMNFMEPEKKQEKYFICTLIILIYLLAFQCYTNVSSINTLKEEIKEINKNKMLIQHTNLVNNEEYKSTEMKDIKEIYALLGHKNIEQLTLKNNKVEIKGKCKDLDILNDLKSMDNVKNFSVTSIERNNKKFNFQVTYKIGGSNSVEE